MQSNGANICYFKLRLFDQTESSFKFLRLQRYSDPKIRVCVKHSNPDIEVKKKFTLGFKAFNVLKVICRAKGLKI